MTKYVYALLIVLMFSCTNPDRAQETLENQGYTQVEITGYRYGACAESDSTCTGFTATSPVGRPVSGAVGCGHGCGFKGCTIRFD
jgi:hypothetical protein